MADAKRCAWANPDNALMCEYHDREWGVPVHDDRLRMIFEEPDRVELKRATIAGYEPEKAARFGAYAGMDPARQSKL